MTDDLREALQNLSNIFCSLRLDRLYVASGKVTVAIDKADSVGRNRVLIENLRNELELRQVKELSRHYDSGQVFVLFKNGGFFVFGRRLLLFRLDFPQFFTDRGAFFGRFNSTLGGSALLLGGRRGRTGFLRLCRRRVWGCLFLLLNGCAQQVIQ